MHLARVKIVAMFPPGWRELRRGLPAYRRVERRVEAVTVKARQVLHRKSVLTA